MPSIPLDAFYSRQDHIRRFLATEAYEALIILDPHNCYYLSGFFVDVLTWERPIALVIPRDAAPFFILNELSTHHIYMAKEQNTLAVDDTVFYTEHPSSTQRTFTRFQWLELLAKKLKARGIDRGVLACDIPSPMLHRLDDHLPKTRLVTESSLLRNMRLVKDRHELEMIRPAGRLSDYGQSVYKECLTPGQIMLAVDAEVQKEMILKGAEMFPGDRVECGVYSLTGPASASPHGTGRDSDAVIEKGHGIVNIIIVRLNGYVVENERTWIMGNPTPTQENAFIAATAATRAATEQMIAGNQTSSIDAAAQAVIEAAGFGENIFHRTGHGIGIAGHEYPDDVAFNHRPLKAGEVWSAEPGIYLYGIGGFRQDDTVIVGEEQPEIVTNWTHDLADQIIPV